MTELDEALAAARDAYAAAGKALALAEAAAGVDPASSDAVVVDELTVKRINVVEDDGTLRIVIGNSSHGRMLPLRGRLIEHPGRNESAGILFVNDEGTECGGLQFRGRRDDQNGPEQIGYMTFDDYEQNESFRLGLLQHSGSSQKFLEFSDQPSWSLADLAAETEDLDEDMRKPVYEKYFGHVEGRARSRVRLAREDDGSVQLILRDGQGRDRLRFVVPSDGQPVAEVIDADGAARSFI